MRANRVRISPIPTFHTPQESGSGGGGGGIGGGALRAHRAIESESPSLRVLRSVGRRALREERRQYAIEEMRREREECVAAAAEHEYRQQRAQQPRRHDLPTNETCNA